MKMLKDTPFAEVCENQPCVNLRNGIWIDTKTLSDALTLAAWIRQEIAATNSVEWNMTSVNLRSATDQMILKEAQMKQYLERAC